VHYRHRILVGVGEIAEAVEDACHIINRELLAEGPRRAASSSVPPLPDPAPLGVQPRVHQCRRQIQYELPELKLWGTQPSPLMPLNPLSQCVIVQAGAQPADGVPRARRQDTTRQELAVLRPAQPVKIAIPEELAEQLREFAGHRNR
jgi:hypothetical protein